MISGIGGIRKWDDCAEFLLLGATTLQVCAGGVMIAMGAAMVTGQLSAFSFWLLETFPVFQTIG